MVSFSHLHQRFLSNSIRSIGFFWVSIPKVFLLKGNRCKLRISTNRSEHDELHPISMESVTVLSCSFYHIHSHSKIVVHKLAGIFFVGLNTAHTTSSMYDNVGFVMPKHFLASITITKIINLARD